MAAGRRPTGRPFPGCALPPVFPVASLSVCSRRSGLGPAVARLECAGVRGAGRGRGAPGAGSPGGCAAARRRGPGKQSSSVSGRGVRSVPRSPPSVLSPALASCPDTRAVPSPSQAGWGAGSPDPESAGGSRNGTRKMSLRGTPERRSATPSFSSFSSSHPPAAEGPRGKEATGAVRVGAGGAEAGPSVRVSGLLGAAGGPRGPSSAGFV